MKKYWTTNLICMVILLTAFAAYAQWVQTTVPRVGGTAYALAAGNGYLFAGSDSGSGVYRTADNGATWTAGFGGFPAGVVVSDLAVSGNYLFAGSRNAGIFRKGNGTNWTAVTTGLPVGSGFIGFGVSGSYLFAGMGDSGIYRTGDSGATWTAVNTGLSGSWFHGFEVNGGYIFAGTDDDYGNNMFRSANNGANWTAVSNGLPVAGGGRNGQFWAMVTNGGYVFAGTIGNGIYRTGDNGANWTAVNTGLPAGSMVFSFAAGGNFLFAGTHTGVYRTGDNGESWTAVSTGLPDSSGVIALLANNGYLFAGIGQRFVWCRPLSELGVAVLPGSQKGALLQTLVQAEYAHMNIMVHFAVGSTCDIAVSIYNLSGKKMFYAKRENQGRGANSISINTGKMNTGLYICKFQAGEYQNSSTFLVAKE